MDADRLTFAPKTGLADYITRLRLTDLFLVTFPYNAGTIVSDALRMGFPVVTLTGEPLRHAWPAGLWNLPQCRTLRLPNKWGNGDRLLECGGDGGWLSHCPLGAT